MVDEEPPRSAEDAELCIIEARSRRRRYELIHRWNDAVGRVGGPLLDPGTSHPEYILDQHMHGIGDAFAWEDGAWDALRDRLRASGVRVPRAAHFRRSGRRRRHAADRGAARHGKGAGRTAGCASASISPTAPSQPQASGLWRMLLDAFTASAWDQWGRIVEEVAAHPRPDRGGCPARRAHPPARRGGPRLGWPDHGIPRRRGRRRAGGHGAAGLGVAPSRHLARRDHRRRRPGCPAASARRQTPGRRQRHRQPGRPNLPGWPLPSGSPTPSAGH